MKDRIKQIRKYHKETQQSFGASLNVSKSTIESIEYGRREVTDRVVADICRVYNIDENWLRTGEGEMFAKKDREQEIAEIVGQMFKDDESSYRFQLQRLISDCDDQVIEALFNFSKSWVDNVNKSKEKELPED